MSNYLRFQCDQSFAYESNQCHSAIKHETKCKLEKPLQCFLKKILSSGSQRNNFKNYSCIPTLFHCIFFHFLKHCTIFIPQETNFLTIVFFYFSLQALNGFLMMATQTGKLLYISDNAAEYLGHSMVSVYYHTGWPNQQWAMHTLHSP